MSAPPTRPLAPTVLPMARAVAPRFPYIPMTRGSAAVDLLLVAAAIVGSNLLMLAGDLSGRLRAWWPEGGILLWPLFNGAICLALIAAALRLRRQSLDALGLGRIEPSKAIVAALAAAPVCVFVGAMSNIVFMLATRRSMGQVVQERAEFLGHFSEAPLGLIVPMSIFVGVYEEILFRGFLLGRLRALTRSDAAALIVSSALFGAAHYSTQGSIGMVQTALVGGVLGGTVLMTRSLWPAILAHAAFDAFNLGVVSLLGDQMQEAVRMLTSTRAAG